MSSNGSASSSVEIAKRYFSAINETRIDDLGEVFGENAVLTFPMLPPIRGRRAIQDFYSGVLQFYPRRYDNVTHWFISEDGGVAAEIHFEGETATGRSVIFDAVDLFRIQDGKISELRIFYDSAKVMQMVGELPK